MSATRDKTQKITFVYSNLYSIYRKGVERARDGAALDSGEFSKSLATEALNHIALGRNPGSGAVLKTGSPSLAPSVSTPPPAPRVTSYTPAQLIGKRVARPTVLPLPATASAAKAMAPVESLKQNLKDLNDLQARLRFMLKELEDLIKE